jgi:hypothetical protein
MDLLIHNVMDLIIFKLIQYYKNYFYFYFWIPNFNDW